MKNFSSKKINKLKSNARFSPGNRLIILKVGLKKQLELDDKTVSDEKLTRAIRSAHIQVGVNINDECSFDSDPVLCLQFLTLLKNHLQTYANLRLTLNYLANKVANALHFKDRLEMLGTLALYQNILENKWIFNHKLIKKLKGLNNLTDGSHVSIPSLHDKIGIQYQITKLDDVDNYYVLYSMKHSFFTVTTAYRDWGITPHELISWRVANEVIKYGPKTWNSLILAMSYQDNAENSDNSWIESKTRDKELLKLIGIQV